jgi:hypothetical protein
MMGARSPCARAGAHHVSRSGRSKDGLPPSASPPECRVTRCLSPSPSTSSTHTPVCLLRFSYLSLCFFWAPFPARPVAVYHHQHLSPQPAIYLSRLIIRSRDYKHGQTEQTGYNSSTVLRATGSTATLGCESKSEQGKSTGGSTCATPSCPYSCLAGIAISQCSGTDSCLLTSCFVTLFSTRLPHPLKFLPEKRDS